MLLDDRELIIRILDGDVEAADLFVTRFTRFVWAILVRHLHLGTETAEDLHQEVFVRLWEDDYRRLRLWSRNGDFVSYLGPIVRNLALDRLRDRRASIDVPIEDDVGNLLHPDPDPEERARLEEQRRTLERAVADLSERDRRLYRHRYELDESYREIAVALGMTVNHVGVRLSRLTDRLSRQLSLGVRSPGAASSTE